MRSLVFTFLSCCFLNIFCFQQANAQQPNVPVPLFFDVEMAPTGSNSFLVNVALESERLAEKNAPEFIKCAFELKSAQGQILQNAEFDVVESNYEKVNQTFYFSFPLQAVVLQESILVVTITDTVTGDVVRQEVPLRKINQRVSFQLVNHTRHDYLAFVLPTDSLELVDLGNKTVFLLRFKDDFLPAAPPMGNDHAPASPALSIDTIVQVMTNQLFVLPKEGLYFAQTDTTGTVGMGFRVQEDYPKYKKVENLARCMIYISTDAEIGGMLKAPEKKAVLDNFWLNAGGTVENASKLVRTYYQRVAYANRSFTNYKEGWKTDKGLVHIVFGRPDEILKLPDGERWVYFEGKKQHKMTFEFMRRPNIFTGEHYELVRSPLYRRLWFDAVDQWRTGELE